MQTMRKPGPISPITLLASTTASACILYWAICGPASLNTQWQKKNLSSCPKLIDSYINGPFVHRHDGEVCREQSCATEADCHCRPTSYEDTRMGLFNSTSVKRSRPIKGSYSYQLQNLPAVAPSPHEHAKLHDHPKLHKLHH